MGSLQYLLPQDLPFLVNMYKTGYPVDDLLMLELKLASLSPSTKLPPLRSVFLHLQVGQLIFLRNIHLALQIGMASSN